MMVRRYSLLLCVFLFCACKTSQTMATPEQKQLQKEFAETTTFKVSSNWANPLQTTGMNALNNSGLIPPGSSASRMNLDKGSNYVIIKGSEVDIDLPYYGEIQIGGGYNTKDNGIRYEGTVNDLVVKYNEKRNLYRITFRMKKDTESFDMTIELFENLTTRINVNSSHRTSITYDGSAETLEEPVE